LGRNRVELWLDLDCPERPYPKSLDKPGLSLDIGLMLFIERGQAMTSKRTIKAKDIVNDIRSGMTNLQLMEKHNLSSKGLQSIFTKLMDAKAVKDRELDGRTPLADDTVNLNQMRVLPRNYLFLNLPVYEADEMKIEGQIRDITEKGLQVAGIPVGVGDYKTLLVRAEDFDNIRPFTLRAQCRWTKPATAVEPDVAGYQIKDISEGALEELRKLIHAVTFGD
jgi:hypothetical protein